MDWQQHFPPHSRKSYSLDLLFSSSICSMVCHHIPASDSLVIGDPDHHENAFFKINGLGLESTDSESENKPLKNCVKANYDVISAALDIDWDSLLECGVDEGGH